MLQQSGGFSGDWVSKCCNLRADCNYHGALGLVVRKELIAISLSHYELRNKGRNQILFFLVHLNVTIYGSLDLPGYSCCFRLFFSDEDYRTNHVCGNCLYSFVCQ
jgi:hypothetical protein